MTLGTLEIVAFEAARGVGLLAAELAPATAGHLLASIGVRPIAAIVDAPAWLSARAQAAASIGALTASIDQVGASLGTDDAGASAAAQLLADLAVAVLSVRGLGDALAGLADTLPGLSTVERTVLHERARHLPRRLLDRLLVDDLERRLPSFTAVLVLLGVVEREELTDGGAAGVATAFTRRRLRIDRVAQVVADPGGVLRDRYGWGLPTFDGMALFETLRAILADTFERPAEILVAPGLPPALEAGGFRIQVDDAASPPGLEVSLRVPGELDGTGELVAGEWRIATELAVAFAPDLDFGLLPPFDVELRVPGATAEVQIAIAARRAPTAAPALVLGRPGRSRVEARAIEAAVGLSARWSPAAPRAPLVPELRLTLAGLRVVIAAGDGGALAGALVGDRDPSSGVDLALRWSPVTGLRFDAGGAAGVDLPASARLGPVAIDTVHLALALDPPAPSVEASVTASVRVGPVTLTLARFGLRARATVPDGGGNIGPLDLELGVRPPATIGLSLDAAAITAAGALTLDPDRGHYAGGLTVRVADWLVLDALGVLDRAPGTAAPWSFLALIGARFGRIPIGMGFALDGVGGIVGVHRALDVEALRADLRRGAVSELFGGGGGEPTARLRRVERTFPVTPGRHVIGPAARLGWGTPQLLRADVAVMFEVPAPVRVVLLAAIEVGLPTLDHRIVDLRLDALGVLDPGRKTLALDASLHDSKLAGYELTGDMALRLGWGAEPHLLFSVGGFHPRFRPPAGFPALRRLALTVGDNPRLRLEAYLALTSNTAQLGAHVDLHYKLAGLKIAGHLHFDALIELQPLHFEIDLAAGVALSYRGANLASVRLAFLLTGPRPWHAKGTATIGILWWDVTVGFDVTWGDRTPPPLPPAPDLAALLRAALSAPEAWAGELPAGERAWIALRDGADAGGVRVHPAAELVVRQRVLPLDHAITRYVTTPLGRSVRFRIRSAATGDTSPPIEPVTDHFAPGQYTLLRRDEQLAAPSFERMPSGVRIAAPPVLGSQARMTMEPDTVIDDPMAPPRPRPVAATTSASLLAVVAAQRPTAAAGTARPPRRRIVVRPPSFVLASNDRLDITAAGAALAAGRTTYAALREALREVRATGARPPLQIVPRAVTSNPRARVVVVREVDELNTDFVDTVTGANMSTAQLVAAIHAGQYPDYEVRKIHGRDTPMSKANASTDDNLG